MTARITPQVGLPLLDRIRRKLVRLLTRLSDEPPQAFNVGVSYRRARDGTWNVYVNERVVEIPFALRAITDLPEGSSILELGCTQSLLALSLAACGYKVHGVDLRPYQLTHPNLQVTTGDFLEVALGDAFDCFVAISSLEHAGLQYYGEQQSERGDVKIVQRARSILKPSGRLVITVPFGRPMNVYKRGRPFQRVYDTAELERLLLGFTVIEEQFYHTRDFTTWCRAEKELVEQVDNTRYENGLAREGGVACVLGQLSADVKHVRAH